MCQAQQPESLRSAALLALAQMDESIAVRHAGAFESESSILLKASAAFTRYLVGDSHRAFNDLIGLVDGSETDQIIARCLADMGTVINPWLLDVAANPQALPSAREICFSLACDVAAPNGPSFYR